MIRLLAARAFWICLGLFALIEAIFVAESFTTLMEGVVENGGSAWDLARLLVFKMPEIIDFALPLVLVIGFYFALTMVREEGGFVVCAAAGQRWWRLPVFTALIGALVAVVSLGFSGVITPTAKLMGRLAQHELSSRRIVREIVAPSGTDAIRTIDGRTYAAFPSQAAGGERGPLFIFEEEPKGAWRASHADDWVIDGPDEGGAYRVRMKRFRDYLGRPTASGVEIALDRPREVVGGLGQARFRVESVELDFRMDEIIERVDDERRGGERLLFTAALLSGAEPLTIDRRLGESSARAILCLFAALVAVAGAGMSGLRWGRYVALPAGVIAVLAADVVLRAVLGDAAAQGAVGFWRASGFAVLAALAVPLFAVIAIGERLIVPARGRA